MMDQQAHNGAHRTPATIMDWMRRAVVMRREARRRRDAALRLAKGGCLSREYADSVAECEDESATFRARARLEAGIPVGRSRYLGRCPVCGWPVGVGGFTIRTQLREVPCHASCLSSDLVTALRDRGRRLS